MPRYLIYLTVGILAYVLGVYFAYSFYWKADEAVVQQKQETVLTKAEPSQQTSNTTDKTPSNLIDLETIFTDQQNIKYKGFSIFIQNRKHDFENQRAVDVEYVVLKRNNRKIFESDKVLDEIEMSLRSIRFGFFPFLGDEKNKQLVIESSGHRYFRYTIINLSPKFEILFDSNDYNLTNDLKIIDFNQDGKYEFAQDLNSSDYFYILQDLRKAVSGFKLGYASTSIAFQYNAKRRKYIFANPKLSEYLLKHSDIENSIEEKLARIKEINASGDKRDLFSAVMDAFLTYAYLGKEKEAWNAIEESDLPDKETIKTAIKKFLADDNLYQIARKSQR